MSVETRGAREEERDAIAHVIDLAFDRESYGPSLREPCLYVGHSDMDPHDRAGNTRILIHNIASVKRIAETSAWEDVYDRDYIMAFDLAE